MNTKYFVAILLVAGVLLLGGVVVAQEETIKLIPDIEELPEAGLAPDNPFYFLDRFFDEVGVFFTADNIAKAQRRLQIAEERLAEAKKLAEANSEKVEQAIAFWEDQLDQADASVEESDDAALTEQMAKIAEKHAAVLERILDKQKKLEQANEKAIAAIEQAKVKSLNKHFQVVQRIEKKLPEKAAEILEKAAERRLRFLERAAEEKDNEQVLNQLKDYNLFFERLTTSTSSTTTQPFLKHVQVLNRVLLKAPEQAREGLRRALENVERLQIKKLEDNNATTTDDEEDEEEDED